MGYGESRYLAEIFVGLLNAPAPAEYVILDHHTVRVLKATRLSYDLTDYILKRNNEYSIKSITINTTSIMTALYIFNIIHAYNNDGHELVGSVQL